MRSLLLGALGLVACAGAAPPAAHPPAAPVESAAPREPLAWAELDDATFARAKRERRFVILDGAAEWCHWCHVMEATTYHDPAVQALLRERFIAVKVDVDARPDIEERYSDWGWPATVIFSPDGEEIGKYKGYLGPERFLEILRAVAGGATATAPAPSATPTAPLTEEQLASIARATERRLADYWDAAQGGWGHAQKAPLMWNNAWALERAKAGDAEARAHVLFTLAQQRKIVDPVWGGIYQYSAGTDWSHPHFEKLATWQAGAIDNYAAAFALTKDPAMLATARAIQGYVDRFMTSAQGGFYATQDADLNAHDRTRPFLDGHAYYAKSERERLALGVPRIDTHEYARENGLVIAAYATLYEATGDAAVLASAKKAALRMLTTHAAPGGSGGLTHDEATSATTLYLADNAAMAWGLVRLHEVTREREWLDGAVRILEFVKRELADEAGGFFASTRDPKAVGVFAIRRKPFEDNVLAIRAMARVARASGDAAWRPVIAGALRAVATPRAIEERGRMLGDLLLALEETRGVRPVPRPR